MNIGIVGSSGYLGSNLNLALGRNHDVKKLSLRKDCGSDQVYVGGWDIREIEPLEMEALVVCVSPSAEECNREPIETLKLILVELERLIRVACKCGVRKIVYMSTCRVYKTTDMRVTEGSRQDHLEMYSLSHLAGESAIRDICLSEEVSGIALRLSNVFGSRLIGKRNNPMWKLAANSFMSDIALKRRVVVNAPEAQRDFLPISIVEVAIERYLAGSAGTAGFEVANVASGYTLTMLEIRDLLLDIYCGGVTNSSIETLLERIRTNSGDRRLIEWGRSRRLGLYEEADIHKAYVDDAELTMHLLSSGDGLA